MRSQFKEGTSINSCLGFTDLTKTSGPIKHQANVIVGGPTVGESSSSIRKSYTRELQSKKFHLNGDQPTEFREKETEHLDPEHDDALVISLKIADALVERILIDTKSSVNILSYNAL